MNSHKYSVFMTQLNTLLPPPMYVRMYIYHYTTPHLHLAISIFPPSYPSLCLQPAPTFHCLLACRTTGACSARDKRLIGEAGEGDGGAESPPEPAEGQPLPPPLNFPSLYWEHAHHHSIPADCQEGTGPTSTAACCTADHCGPEGVSFHMLYQACSACMYMYCTYTPAYVHTCTLLSVRMCIHTLLCL